MSWSDHDPAPLLGPECERDYLTLTGLGLLVLSVASLVAIALPLFLK